MVDESFIASPQVVQHFSDVVILEVLLLGITMFVFTRMAMAVFV